MAKLNIQRMDGESEADYRRRYHRAWEIEDRRSRGIGPKRKPGGPCSVEGCERPDEIKGMCGKHYRAERLRVRQREGIVENSLRDNPLYSAWFERRSRGGMCEAWKHFPSFLKDVGERPSANHYVSRVVRHQPYGPDNFTWKEFVKREPGESDVAFNARKWQAQKQRRPDFDKRRHLVRSFGITEATYEAMFAAQDGRCAICKEPETMLDARRGAPRSLAVDHCHDTDVVRDLLCWRCNPVLGRVGESVEILQAMIDYLQKWKDPEATAAALGRPERVRPKQLLRLILDTEWGPLPLAEAAERAGLKPGTVSSRLQKGWPKDKLLLSLRRPWKKPKP